jgi:heat-inducible transcriptional repressor
VIGIGDRLDPRARDVLASVVDVYIRSAAPVSSRQLSRSGSFQLSPASLRGLMADLEELGFLTHPHVSAGRVPTDLGFRTFVRELMTTRRPSPEERARIASELGGESVEMDRFLQNASRVLSRLTGEVGIAAAPDAARFVLESIHFARVGERKVLVVQVSDSGLVESRLIETREDFSHEELEASSRRLTEEHHGRSLAEARAHVLAALAQEKVRFDAALARALSLAKEALAGPPGAEGTLFVQGTETILGKPEFHSDLEALRRMFHALDEEVRLLTLLTECLTQPGTTIVIGSDSPLTDEVGASLVATSYGTGGRALGVIGVFGPRRMEYGRVVPLVEEIGRSVSRKLSGGEG